MLLLRAIQDFSVSIPNRDFSEFKLQLLTILQHLVGVSIPNRDFSEFKLSVLFCPSVSAQFQSLIGILVSLNLSDLFPNNLAFGFNP